ncbi:predicted protein [Chaetoceros tenuissimus]|uniref:Uncharacterized protein n=1 Tax=Chaetoceros tenuissimus TaxID=426638 RepID=A0AAD3CLC7_9STRA|nr:predicted protein [Chaetoceros tenuissimus]
MKKTQTHKIPSLEEAKEFSKSKNWGESCSSFKIGALVQVVGGKELNEGFLFGRVVKETSKFIWIFCANGKTQQKSKKYVELAQMSHKPSAATSIPEATDKDISQTSRQPSVAASIPEAVPSKDVSQVSRQPSAAAASIEYVSQVSRQPSVAASIPEAVPSEYVSQVSRQPSVAASIPEAVPSKDVSQVSRQPFATLSADPNVSFGGRKNEKRKRCADVKDRRIILSKKSGNRLNVNVRKKPRLNNANFGGRSVLPFSPGLASLSPAVNKKSKPVLRKTPGHHLKRRSMQKYSKKENSPLLRSIAREGKGFDFSASREKMPTARSKTYNAMRFDFGLKIEHNQSPANSFPQGKSSKREFVTAARAILESSSVEKSKDIVSALGHIPPPPGFSALGQTLPPSSSTNASNEPVVTVRKKASTRDPFDSIFGI